MIIDDRDVNAKFEPDIEKLGEACLVLTAFECKEQAKLVVDVLITEHLASCVQLHDVESTYVWKGEVVRTKETVTSIRTMTNVYPKLKERLTKLHPYELPEIIQIPVADGLDAYVDWIARNTVRSCVPNSTAE